MIPKLVDTGTNWRDTIQLRAVEQPTHIFAGQWYAPVARAKNVSGNVVSPVVVFWNVEKKK